VQPPNNPSMNPKDGPRESTTTRQIRILLAEDVAAHAELALREIRRAGLRCEVRVVETAPEFRRELREFLPDVILSDFAMPNFDGMQALEIARQASPETPFIFVSGMLGEENAIRALKQGATDYVLKGNLLRLPAAIERAVAEAELRADQYALELELRESEQRHRHLFQSNPHPMWIFDVETLYFLDVNQAAISKYGYSHDEFLAMTITAIRPPEEIPKLLEQIAIASGALNIPGTWKHRTKSGELLIVEIASHDIAVKGKRGKLVVAYDVTERQNAERKLAESESRFRELIEQAADGIYLSDVRGNFLLMNSRGCEMLGYSRDEIASLNGEATCVESDREGYRERLDAVRKGKSLRVERMILRKDGTVFPAEVSLKMLGNGVVQAIFHDITQRKHYEDKILRLTRIHAVLSSINSAIVRIQNREELFVEACRIASHHGAFHIAWIGIVEAGVLKPVAWAGSGSELFAKINEVGSGIELSPGGLANRAYLAQHSVFSNDITDNPNLDFVRREVVSLGCRSAIALPLSVSGKAIGIFMLYCDQKDFFDAEEIKLLEELAGDVSFSLNYIAQQEKVDFLAYYDPLTGLPNRSLFFDRLTQTLKGASRDHENIALIVLDLDRFRMMNDTLGRQGGDALLQAVTTRLRGVVRNRDTVARVGSNSFALAVPGMWKAEDVAYAMELRSREIFDEPFILDGEELRITAAGGIALSPGDGVTAEALFANAEAAMRKAKDENERFLFYSPEMNVRVAETLRLENQLRRALENGELVLWYQPKIALDTGKLTGFEALMRWEHPEDGLIAPARFIPLMEQTGLILEAGNWAMLQTCRDCKSWVEQGFAVPRIAVNASPIQLRNKAFVSMVVEAASRMEEAGSSLDLEITESVIMEDVEQIVPILQTIRGLGVEIYVDDFGTGYSSLAYIARLPIHSLKIDRSFVVGMTQDPDSLAIVKSVISLAHSLRLRVVAEGVETEEQATLLRGLRCDQAQGYLFGRPVPVEKVADVLKRFT
jgi:diguanylate cyclase (GGDEF)-like protein/PAS domain S-box-containing protein